MSATRALRPRQAVENENFETPRKSSLRSATKAVSGRKSFATPISSNKKSPGRTVPSTSTSVMSSGSGREGNPPHAHTPRRVLDINIDESDDEKENVDPSGKVVACSEKRIVRRSARKVLHEPATPASALAESIFAMTMSSGRKSLSRSCKRGTDGDTALTLDLNTSPEDERKGLITPPRNRRSCQNLAQKFASTASTRTPNTELSPIKSSNAREKEYVREVVYAGRTIKIAKVRTPIRMCLKKCGDDFRISNTPKSSSRSTVTAKRSVNLDETYEKSSSEDDEDGSFDGSGSDDESDYESVTARGSRSPTGVSPSPEKKARLNAVRLPRGAQRQSETLETVIRRLHTSEVPENLPCREEQLERVEQFVRASIARDGESAAMYISGVPGTGKTATVQAVIRKLKREKGVPAFIYVYVNAMELMDPKQFFVNVYSGVTGDTKRISPTAARRRLNQMFDMIDKKRPPVIILVDELDHMCTKRQELIYDVFNWTTNEKARVNIMAIANTLDLPERLLCQRVASRLGSNRVCFDPYDFSQIDLITRERLSGSKAVSDDAIEYTSRKVAHLSGDLRKAIDILRRAAELALEQKAEQLTMQHVQEAVKEAASTVRAGFVNGLSRHQLTVFRAAVSQVQSTGVDEFHFYELFKHYQVLCTQLEGVAPFNETRVRDMVCILGSMRLLVVAQGGGGHARSWWAKKMRLGTTVQEAQFALKQADDERKATDS